MSSLTRNRSNVSSSAIAIQNSIHALSGLRSLYSETLGDPRICIAVLDGPVDQSHPCFEGANLTQLQTLVSGFSKSGSVAQHGTHVTSIIFGQPNSSVPGIAPRCRGLIVPVFADEREFLAPCSQLDLARAITQAVEQGANVINISGGQLTQSGEPDPFLTNAIQLCRENNVLIVAATGNDGCACLHLPAAIASVLAVGAMNAQSQPMGFSNWGEAYQTNGILAPGENILGAVPGGGTKTMSGTSFAAPIVSGIVALLLSLQLKQGSKPDPEAVREAILQSALPCPPPSSDCQRFLVGSLNVPGAYALITKGENLVMIAQNQEEAMIQPSATAQESAPVLEMSQPSEMSHPSLEAATATLSSAAPLTVPHHPAATAVTPSGAEGECSCGGGAGKQVQLVYALGELGTDFGSEARRDAFNQAKPEGMPLLDYLDQNPWEAQSLIWTLNLDATPIYAIVPMGAYASVTYERLRSFLRDENIERVSIPGHIAGSIRLMSGQTVPIIVPEIRGIYGWSIAALIEQLMQINSTGASEQGYRNKIQEYLERIYYEFRNLGTTPQERALNFSATNAFQIADVMSTGTAADVGLDTITVEKSPICRPDSECYDVKVKFFNLQDSRRAGKVFRFTVDVSDVIPVSIGRVRSWSVAS